MPTSTNTTTNTFDASVRNAIDQLQQQDSRFDHVILATADGSTSRTAPFQLVALAAGGLDALRSKLDGPETRFALLRVHARILLVVSLGQGIGGLKRAQVLVQGRALQSSLGAVLFAALTIASTAQLSAALVSSKLQLEGFAYVPSPDLSQDFRASWASTSTTAAAVGAGVGTRAKPSAPSSPEEAGLEGSWSRPVSDVGPLHRAAAAAAAGGLRTKSLLVSPSAGQLAQSAHGIVIDLASVVDAPTHTTPKLPATLPLLPLLPLLPPVECGIGEASTDSLTARWTSQRSRTPSDPGSPRVRLTADERKRLSDERDRLRADEVIREQVMKKLRAEQKGVLRSPGARTPRLAVSPPLAPPPPFAPPPTPRTVDSQLARSPRRAAGGMASPRAAAGPKLEEEAEAAVSESARCKGLEAGEDVETCVQRWAGTDARSSQSHESIRSSIHSMNLWEFADAASRTHSLLHLPGRAKGSASGTVTPSHARSRQGSGSESDPQCTASSSRGSVAASSLFDKELPALPSDESDGDEWIGGLEGPGSPTYPTRSLRPASLPKDAQRAESEDAELHDLRERLALAEARAKAAETAAEVAVREAQDQTRRLAEELARVERGTRETMEAEAVRRAKWAREQVARDRLDAYERSKLEAAEARRRRAIEEQRRVECERAQRIREERVWREQEAERVTREYEVRITQLAKREARLKREAEERERRERERKEQRRAEEALRHKRLEELKEAVREGGEVLSGWLNVHTDEAVHAKRRWYRVSGRQLEMLRSATDRAALTRIPLDKYAVEMCHEDGCVSHALRLEVEEGEGRKTYVVSMDTRAAMLDLQLVVEAVKAASGRW